MKILIVDDSKVMRSIVMRQLRQAGFGGCDFVEASNGREGLETVRTQSFDLVLCDWNMPEMTGIQMLQAIKKEGIDVRFGFVTSEGTEDMRAKARESGALFLIAKPFTADTFVEKLEGVLA